MAEDIHIDAPDLESFIAKLGGFDAAFGPIASNLLHRSALGVQAEAMKRTPVLTGHLRRSEVVAVDPAPYPTFATIGTNLVYAGFIEFGERAAKGGTVKRKAGPARMLRDGATAASGLIVEAIEAAKREIAAKWKL